MNTTPIESSSQPAADASAAPAIASIPAAKNPMRKIIAMVGIAILVFLAVTALSVSKSLQGNSHLAAVKDVYFPILQKIESNNVRLDKMEELFMRAVMTGDHDGVDEAETVFQAGDHEFAEMAGIYPAQAADIGRLRTEFKHYHDFATDAADNFLKSPHGDMQVQAKAMNAMLTALRGSMKNFRTASYNRFVQTLAETQDTVKLNLYMGIAIGAMNLCFMAVLVFFIRNNVRMMSVIAEQNATLEKRVAERTLALRQKTVDIQAMLQNMPQGVLTIMAGSKVHPEYSAYLETIFETPSVADRNVMDLVFGDCSLGADTLSSTEVAIASVIGEDSMNYEFNSHLLPTEFEAHTAIGTRKALELTWSPILNDADCVEKLMVCVRDVTELKRLEGEASAQKRELEIIGEILAVSQEKFQDFIQTSVAFVDENRALTEGASGPSAELVAQLFRNMHTVKGNARTYGLGNLTNTVHEAEQAYDDLRKGDGVDWQRDALLAQLADVRSILDEYTRINDQKLGRKGPGRRGNVAKFLMVEKVQVEQALEGMGSVDLDDHAATRAALVEMQGLLRRMGADSLPDVLSGIVDSLPSLAHELGKEAPVVQIQDHGILVRSQVSGLLKNLFTHLLRNAVDHGIEKPAVRIAAGKPAEGRITLDMDLRRDVVSMALRDDGQGMALGRIRQTANERGLVQLGASLSDEEIAQLVFLPGFSTAESVTEVSGRGVGMDAVKGFLEREGGHVEVRFLGPRTITGHRPFEFVITLPASFAIGEITRAPDASAPVASTSRETVSH